MAAVQLPAGQPALHGLLYGEGIGGEVAVDAPTKVLWSRILLQAKLGVVTAEQKRGAGVAVVDDSIVGRCQCWLRQACASELCIMCSTCVS
jgi:hypothetical protein